MTSAGGWPEIERVFSEAYGLAPPERAAFLDQACAGQPALRAEVESLLDADPTQVPFLDGPPSLLVADLLESDSEKLGSIGPYRILRLLGEGGMGTVYEAEQNKPQRIVALKVIRAGMASDLILRRFEQETEVLGRLHHPGIAQIYDAGTAENGSGPQPYFAMELVQGPPLRAYAEQRGLDVEARLDLMAKVCEAVNHAHQRGIIHRDLKPGNILVDETGQPKILDFGVARVTDSDVQATRQTDLGQIIGTLAYMSPEQALGNPLELDIRSDVYSLGVILYELLAGKLPYQTNRHTLHEVVQAIREEDPSPLSAVDRGYRGDIEIIAAKALEKDKERRYGSAGELAADIRRHLASVPIVALPPTAVYQFRKFSRRHKAAVIGAAAVFVASIAGAAVSTWQAVRARTAERAAIQHSGDLRQISKSVLFEINDAIQDLPGSTPARRLIVEKSLTYLDRLALAAQQDVSLQGELAEGYNRLSGVQYTFGRANLGDIAGALVSARKAAAIRESIALRDQSPEAQLALANAWHRLGNLLGETGSSVESVAYHGKTLALRELVYAAHPGNTRARDDVAVSYAAAADREQANGNPQGALDWNRKAMAIRRELVRQQPGNATYMRRLSQDLVAIGDNLGSPNEVNLGRFEEALQTYDEALAIREALRKASPGSVTAERDLTSVLLRRGAVFIPLQEYRRAIETSRAALSSFTSMWNADPSNLEFRRDMANVQSQLARAYTGMENYALAEAAYRESIAIRRELVRKNPGSDRAKDNLAATMSVTGQWMANRGRTREAAERYAAAATAFRDLAQRNPGAGGYQSKLVRAVAGLADAHWKLGDRKSACGEYREAVALAGSLQSAGRLGAADQKEAERFGKQLESCK